MVPTYTAFSDDMQKVVTNGYPNLRKHRIHGGTIKGLYMKMLLYTFEEQLNLPSFSIQLSNQREVVGQKPIALKYINISLDVFKKYHS